MKAKILVATSALLVSYYQGSAQASGNSAPLITPELRRLADKIARERMLTGPLVGEAGVKPAQWDRYEKFRSSATVEELQILTGHENPVVRCYSFQALVDRNEKVFPILLRHLADTSRVRTFFGCLINSEKVGDYFIDAATTGCGNEECYKLTKNEVAILDSVILNDALVLVDRKIQLLVTIKPVPKYYQSIRREAVAGNQPAILALARFQNKNDVEIIENLLKNQPGSYYAVCAAKEYPALVFYPYLLKAFEKEWKERLYDYPKWKVLYQALARYPTDEVYQLFRRTTQTHDAFRYQTLGTYLMLALRKYPNPKFAPLIPVIRLDGFHQSDLNSELNAVE